MGLRSSFITNYCIQPEMQLTEENLLSLGYQKIHIDNLQSQDSKQLYQHYQSKKLYTLRKLKCLNKDSDFFVKALHNLQMVKNNHICNLVFSSASNTGFSNIMSKVCQIDVFTQFSSLNLQNLIVKKQAEKIQLSNIQDEQQLIVPFTDIQIANFVHALSGIAAEIGKMCLPIDKIDPLNFAIMENEAGKIKYDIQFDNFVKMDQSVEQSGYFSIQYWQESLHCKKYFCIDEKMWQQKYGKNLIFGLGMLILHFILLQPVNDCYNYKARQFCRSQLENKLSKLTRMLQKRHQTKQSQKNNHKNSTNILYSRTYVDRLETQNSPDYQEEPFQLILYDTIVQMLESDKSKRMTVNQLKYKSRRLMQKVKQDITTVNYQQTFLLNIYQAKAAPPKIGSNRKENSKQSVEKPLKTAEDQYVNTTVSALGQSKSRSFVKQLRPKQVSDKQRSFVLDQQQSFMSDKENIMGNYLQTPNINLMKALKGSIRKLSGYKKVKISENSFIEGYFKNNQAHGLGKIQHKNGEVVECIFHNNEIIQEIARVQIS